MSLGNLLNLFHQSVGDGHSGELFSSTMSTRMRVASQTSHHAHVQIKLVNQPVHRLCRFVGQHSDQLRTRQFARSLQCVFIKLLRRVRNVQSILTASSSYPKIKL